MTARLARGFDEAAADRALRRADPALASWMRRIRLPVGNYEAPFNPVAALARSIIYQQLSGKAAATILGRVEALMLRPGYITVAGLDAVCDEALRAAGLSWQKLGYLRDLADQARAGVVPSAQRLSRMPDQAIIEHLTRVRGVGCWTVQMLLMFRLGRPDILPTDDLGIRKGVKVVCALDRMPTPREVLALGERWAPWRTRASLYLWRISDMVGSGTEVRRSQD